jgi:signal transduction histidine kinase
MRTLTGRLMRAQDDERRRIARMLHETTAQDLAALKMLLARLNRTSDGLDESRRSALTEGVSLAEQAIAQVRTLSYLLHPPFLDENGLVSALRWYAAGFSDRSGIEVELDLPERFERLPLDTETALFRIVQESLINIHRHAQSETARIRMQHDARTLVLEISDQGHGIPEASLKTHPERGRGCGHRRHHERIGQLAGRSRSHRASTARRAQPCAFSCRSGTRRADAARILVRSRRGAQRPGPSSRRNGEPPDRDERCPADPAADGPRTAAAARAPVLDLPEPEEHLAVAVPFIRIGLDRGEKCIYIADEGSEAAVRDAMDGAGIDVERAIATGSLVLEKKEDAYLKRGSFDPQWMFTFWAAAAADAKHQGFSALRATGETEWVARGAPGLERWIEYESRMTHTLAHHNCLALCQYNRRLFPPQVILDVIRTHPTVIYRGVVCRNMYYVPPDELLGTNQSAREVERLLTRIREREEIEYTLRRQRNELRESERRFRRQLQRSGWQRRPFGRARIAGDRSSRTPRSASSSLTCRESLSRRIGRFRNSWDTRPRSSRPSPTPTSPIPTMSFVARRVIEQLVSGAKREVQLEKRYRHKNGTFIWTRATGTMIRGSDGAPRYLLGLVEDVTDRKLAQQELDASVTQLHALAGRLMHEQDDERRRIAQLLHETTAQDLAALKMHLARVSRTASHLSDVDRAALAESISLAEQSMTEVRTLSYLLHPPFLDEMGLLSALRWYVAGFAERSGISVDLELPEQFDRLPRDMETALFRIVQESLINIHRHAESETARIHLRHAAGTLVLEIEDWGRGIPKASLEHITSGEGVVGVGIAGMSERIERLGGRLELTSSARGTTVRVRVPIGTGAD